MTSGDNLFAGDPAWGGESMKSGKRPSVAASMTSSITALTSVSTASGDTREGWEGNGATQQTEAAWTAVTRSVAAITRFGQSGSRALVTKRADHRTLGLSLTSIRRFVEKYGHRFRGVN